MTKTDSLDCTIEYCLENSWQFRRLDARMSNPVFSSLGCHLILLKNCLISALGFALIILLTIHWGKGQDDTLAVASIGTVIAMAFLGIRISMHRHRFLLSEDDAKQIRSLCASSPYLEHYRRTVIQTRNLNGYDLRLMQNVRGLLKQHHAQAIIHRNDMLHN